MGNEWSSSGLKSCQVGEKVEVPVGSTRKCLPWELYHAVSTDAGGGCSLSAFVYSLRADSAGSDSRHIASADVIQAAENNAKWLKRLRHPCIVRFHEVALMSEEVCVVTERVTPLQLVIDSLTPVEICSGLYNVIEAISFLHSVADVSHNNVSVDAIYVTESGVWKLGSFESTRQFDQLSVEFLRTCQPFFNKQTVLTDGLHLGCSADLSGFADLAEYTIEYLSSLGDDLQRFQGRMKELLANDVDQQTFCQLLNDELFRNDFISISCFLEHLPLKSQQEQSEFFTHLVPRLYKLPVDVVGSRLTKTLLSRLVVINPAACRHLMPHLLTPAAGSGQHAESGSENDDDNADVCGILPRSLYCRYVLPELYKIFHVRDMLVRTTLLRHFHRYVDMFDHSTLTHVILPQLLLSVRDVDDELVVLSLNALATLVPVLGGDLVIGEGRQQLFSRGQPKVGSNLPVSNGLLHHTSSNYHHHRHRHQPRAANANTRSACHHDTDSLHTANNYTDSEEERIATNDDRRFNAVNRRSLQDVGEYLSTHHWHDTAHYVTSVNGGSSNSTGQFSGSPDAAKLPQQPRSAGSNKSSRPCVDSVNMSTTRTGSGRLSSAMKLKCNVESQSESQEHSTDTVSHNPGLPSTPAHSPVISISPVSSPGASGQEHNFSVSNKPLSSSSQSAANRPSTQSRRPLSNEPLGAEFDVKQIKVRRAMSNSASTNDEFDFFADMTPVITSSSSEPQKSLLGLLTAAVAETSSTSRLNIADHDQYRLDPSMLSASAGDGWDDEGVDWDTVDM